MAIEFTEEQVREHYRKMNREIPSGLLTETASTTPKRRKYGNKPTQRGGQKFDSQHEADVYDALVFQVKAGELRGLVCQQRFELPGGVGYVADFVTLNIDGTYTVMDAKSVATRKDKVYRIKKRQMHNCLGIEIVEV